MDEFYASLAEIAGSAEAGSLPEWAADTRARFTEAMDDDMNIPGAMAALFDMVHAGNKAMAGKAPSAEEAAAVQSLWKELDSVLGILTPEEETISSEVTELLEARATARAEKNWAESDRIRDALAELGWTVKDTPEGPKLRKLQR